MYCPRCESEYVDGVATCAECDVPLVEEAPAHTADARVVPAPVSKRPPSDAEPVVVLSSGRAEQVAVAKSILLSAGVEFGVSGEEVQDLFGYGRFPAGSNIFMGPIRIMVAAEDAEEATALLSDLMTGAPAPEVPQPMRIEENPGGEPVRTGSTWALFRTAGKVLALVLLAVMGMEFAWVVLTSLLQ